MLIKALLEHHQGEKAYEAFTTTVVLTSSNAPARGAPRGQYYHISLKILELAAICSDLTSRPKTAEGPIVAKQFANATRIYNTNSLAN